MSESEVIAIIRNSFSNLRQVPTAYTKSPKPAKDIDGFYRLVDQALRQWQLQEGKAEDKLYVFTEEFPPDPYQRETISFSLTSREPAVMGKSAPQGSPREIKPNVRQAFDDPDVPGYKIYEIGWMMDNYIMFCMWSQSNLEANRMALWFEDFMNNFMWFFRSEGINQLFFEKRDSDFQIHDKRLVGRPLVYYVRTEKVTQVQEKVLEELVVNLTISTDISEVTGYSAVR